MNRNSRLWAGVAGFILCGTCIPASWAGSGKGPRFPDHPFGTGAFAVRETDSLEAITDAITGILSPLVPPALSQTLPSVGLPAIGTLAVSATTVNDPHGSVSDSSAQTITIDVLSDTILISSAESETRARCNGVFPDLNGTSSVGSVTVNGTPVTVTGEDNQVVPLPNSGGHLVLNEKFRDEGQYGGYVSVSAVNAYATSAQRVRTIAHTEGFANCF